MAVTNHHALIKKLKKQVALLQKKEEQGRKQLHVAIKKMEKHGKLYKTKLAKQMRLMQAKIAKSKSTAYAKAVSDLEVKMLRGVASKAKALANAAKRIEKKHFAKLARAIAKKSKRNQG